MVLKFVCEYNGKDFHGFQAQGKLRTVQGVLQDALTKYFGEQIKIVGSGRTDAGVHARGQVVSFRAPRPCALWVGISGTHKVCTAINAFLPPDVSVRDFEIKPDTFHAQFSAKSKTYIYRCYVSQHRSPLRDATHLQLYKWPDIDKMKAIAKNFIGTQNFAEYTTDKTDSKDFVRTIFNFDVICGAGNSAGLDCFVPRNDDELWLVVRGSGFMRNMVRIMCGKVLGANKTLPAHGLILDCVEY